MNYYEESKSERVNQRAAILLTAAIYFILFSGIVFANQPELLPEFVKEWLNIENSENKEEFKKDLQAEQKNKERA